MRYYGNKEKLLSFIEEAVSSTDPFEGEKFVDLFTGTTTVAKHFKKLGYTVVANDNLEFSYALAKTYIELAEAPKFARLKKYIKTSGNTAQCEAVIAYINQLASVDGFITKNYSPLSGLATRNYFTESNARKIDAIRQQIHTWKTEQLISESEYYYLLTALIEAVNLVSNVAGTYAAAMKKWDPRAHKQLILVPPEIIPSKKKNKAFKMDANELAASVSTDILYIDPPYNSRQYVTNYFMLELIAEGWFDGVKKPQGMTGLLYDRAKKSKYSSKATAKEAFSDLIGRSKARNIVLSYSNEGILSVDDIQQILGRTGEVHKLIRKGHKRYKSINQTADDATSVEERIFVTKNDKIKDRFNNIGGAKWLQNSLSIWKDIRKNKEEQSLNHPAMFPIALVERIIDSFSGSREDVVLDPFVGSGSTMIGAVTKGRTGIGFDLSDEYISMASRRLRDIYAVPEKSGNYELIQDNAELLDKYVAPGSVSLTITSPPYWDILNQRRSVDNKSVRHYGNLQSDLGIIRQYDEFIEGLRRVFLKVYMVTKPGGFCFVIVMDIRKGPDFYPLHCDVIAMMKGIGFVCRDIVIWDRQSEYNSLKPLGYPYSFIINKIHEYVLIFQKPIDG